MESVVAPSTATKTGKAMKIFDEVRIAASNLTDIASDMAEPSLRLGVTGLARAGKTIFISSSLHNIIHSGRLPRFEAHATGALVRQKSASA